MKAALLASGLFPPVTSINLSSPVGRCGAQPPVAIDCLVIELLGAVNRPRVISLTVLGFLALIRFNDCRADISFFSFFFIFLSLFLGEFLYFGLNGLN